MLTPKQKPLLKNCVLGIVITIAGGWFVLSLYPNPYHEYLLLTRGITTNGFITNVCEYEENVDKPDAQGGGSETVTRYITSYNFTTQSGIIVNDSCGAYFEDFKGKPIPVEVVYVPANPQIHTIKGVNLSSSLSEFIWSRLLIGTGMLLLFSSIGFLFIKNAIKEYLASSKKIMT